MTIQEAKNENVFYIHNGNVVATDLYDYLTEFGQGDNATSVDEVEITIYAVDGKEFDSKEEVGEYCDENEVDISEIEEITITEYSHVERSHANYGRRIRSLTNFYEDKDSAEASFIKGLEWYVLEKNWNAPQYFSSEKEAEEERVRMLCLKK